MFKKSFDIMRSFKGDYTSHLAISFCTVNVLKFKKLYIIRKIYIIREGISQEDYDYVHISPKKITKLERIKKKYKTKNKAKQKKQTNKQIKNVFYQIENSKTQIKFVIVCYM